VTVASSVSRDLALSRNLNENHDLPTSSETHLSRSRRNDSRAADSFGRELEREIGPHKFGMWFGGARITLDGTTLNIATSSPFAANWIDVHFGQELRSAARKSVGDGVGIHVHADSVAELAAATEPAQVRQPQGDEARAIDDPVRPGVRGRRSAAAPASPAEDRGEAGLRRLDDLVVGPANSLACSAALQLADGALSAGRSSVIGTSTLFVHGECGVGKTHILQGICRRYLEVGGRPHTVRYVTGEQFTNEYIAAVRSNTIEAFRKRIRRLQLLAIDDVHFLANKTRTQAEFLHTMNAIDLTGARVVMASDDHPRHIRRFSQALVSRFMAGMVVRIDRPDRGMRAEIVRRLAAERGMRLSAAAVDHLAAAGAGSVRELVGAITKLAALRMLAQDSAGSASPAVGEEVGLLLAQQVFTDRAWRTSTPVRLGTIIEEVCRRLAVSKPDLMGSGRHRRVVTARAMVAYLGRELTTQSFPEIAQALGRNCHSTIHTADARLRRQIEAGASLDLGGGEPQAELRELVDQLRQDVLRATAKQDR
jgi:chromosomal replication initiator protein